MCFEKKESHPHTMSLIGDPDCSSFCSTTPTFISPTATLIGTRIQIRATPLLSGQSVSVAETTQNTDCEPKFCVDVSSEHTPNFPSGVTVCNREDDLKTLSQLLRILTIFFNQQQSAAVIIALIPLSPRCYPAQGNLCEIMSLFQVHSPERRNSQKVTNTLQVLKI